MVLVNPSITAVRGFSVTNIVAVPLTTVPVGVASAYSTANPSKLLQNDRGEVDMGMENFFSGLGLAYLPVPRFKTTGAERDAEVVREYIEKAYWISSCVKGGVEEKIAGAVKDPFEFVGTRPRMQRNFTRVPMVQLRICWLNEGIGYGCFAEEDIPKGKLIGEYTGELAKRTRWMSNTYLMSTNEWSKYFLARGLNCPSIVIDAGRKGNELRFVNHIDERAVFKGSSVPAENIGLESIFYEGIFRVLFKASRDIGKGEELRFDYGLGYWLCKGMMPGHFGVYRFKDGRVVSVPVTLTKKPR